MQVNSLEVILPMIIITLFNHVGQFRDPGVCQLYSMPPQTKWLFFIIHTFKSNLEIWVELYSWHHALKPRFILVLSPKIIIHNNIIIKNTNNVHNILTIHTGTIHNS